MAAVLVGLYLNAFQFSAHSSYTGEIARSFFVFGSGWVHREHAENNIHRLSFPKGTSYSAEYHYTK